MKILAKFLLVLCAAGLGLAVGYLWRSKSAPASQDVASASVDSSTKEDGKKSGSSKQSSRAPAVDDSPLATKLERDLSMSAVLLAGFIGWKRSKRRHSPTCLAWRGWRKGIQQLFDW